MSIPKEPRQLMINIMYIVLTALLALNVSAEIFNAFKVVDKGLKESNKNIDESNARIPEALATAAKKDPEKFQTYVDRVPQTRTLSKELSNDIDEIMTYMIDQTGNQNEQIDEGDYRDEYGSIELKGKKDKDITTRYLVEGGKGEELKAKVLEYRDKFLELIDEEDRESFAATMPLEIDDETWNKNKRSNRRGSWAEFNFKQMPLQAALPILNKMKNDVKNTEASVLNYYFEKMGSSDFIVFDKFAVVSAPVKSYIIKGEPFETEVFLSATSKNISNMSISVRGRSLPVREGVAKFTETPNSTGLKKYTASASLLNPTTGKRETYTREFQYEVGERSATVSADMMNVFYIGVDNPISVSAAGISTNDLQVNGTGGGISLKPNGLGKYVVTVNKQGKADITLSGGGLQPTKYEFRVKRIPNPSAQLSNRQSGGKIPNGVFKAQQGLMAVLDNFDFDARCQIKGYRLVKASKRDDPEFSVNGGAKFNAKSATIAKSVKPGDRVYFEEVKAQCPGDAAPRKINELVFNIQ